MTKKHLIALALAGSVASLGGMAYAADAVDNKSSVADPAKPNSGPGVQGFPDTRTGPSTRAPGGETVAPSDKNGSSATTQPSQDSSGVEGMPGNKNGPAAAANEKSKSKTLTP